MIPRTRLLQLILLHSQVLAGAHDFLKKFAVWVEENRVGVAMQGAKESMAALTQSVHMIGADLKNCASVLVEQLLLKATSLPASEKDGICRKIEQWIAGSNFGLEEKCIHPCLLKVAHTVHQRSETDGGS